MNPILAALTGLMLLALPTASAENICYPNRQCHCDYDDGSGTGTPDGGCTLDDLWYYLDLFAQGSVCADEDNGSYTGTADGGVTIDDLFYVFFRFGLTGC